MIQRGHSPVLAITAMSTLEPNALYVVLYLRSENLADTTFHWGLYLHAPGVNRLGVKYHIKSIGSYWIADHGPTGGVLKSFLLVCLVRVAKDIPTSRFSQLDAIMRADDHQLNSGGFTCRVWVMRALERLKGAGILRCNDLTQLEEEIKRIGNRFRADAVANEQPRPITASSLSS